MPSTLFGTAGQSLLPGSADKDILIYHHKFLSLQVGYGSAAAGFALYL